ncbi:hypothetical protein BDR04DRAFT_1106916 [Suillus decipiens]|nr:hypothetical protein BDR04DRAFT_1106916 [Suillus decipiens]
MPLSKKHRCQPASAAAARAAKAHKKSIENSQVCREVLIKQVLSERGLWERKLRMKCPGHGTSDKYCATHNSQVQEGIEDVGHMCIFLPKFQTPKENMPRALDSIGIHIIRKHRMKRWIIRRLTSRGSGQKMLNFK